MDPRFEARRQELLDSPVCPPDLAAEVLLQLDEFLQPFVHSLTEPEQRTHTRAYIQGLVSSLDSKTGHLVCEGDLGHEWLRWDEELGDGPSKMLHAMATYHTSASCHISLSLSSIIT